MHKTIEQLDLVKKQVNEIVSKKQLKTNPKIIVVTKTFSLDKIIPLIENGHIHYGENKIQEAEDKWTDTKIKYKNLNLHMIGKLQTNKIKKALNLFDYIHSLDNDKLAFKLFNYQKDISKNIKYFIQVNVGDEKHKSGIPLNELDKFYEYCIKELTLNVIGLMCLPPINLNSEKYFTLLKDSGLKLNLSEFSMGMSSDYKNAVSHGSTYLRIGTQIMGSRNIT